MPSTVAARAAELLQHARDLVDLVDLADLACNSGEKLHLRGESDLRLAVAQHVSAGVEELGTQPVDVATHENVRPGHVHVVEHNQRIGLVVAAGHRIVECAGLADRVRPPAVRLQTRRRNRDDGCEGLVDIVGGERLDAGHQDVVAHRRAGAEHLRAAQHDAVLVLLGHTDLHEVAVPAVRGRCPAHLRRNDHVAEEQGLVQQPPVPPGDVGAELAPIAVEHFGMAREPREKGCHVVGTATHEAVRQLRPSADRFPAVAQVLGCSRDQERLERLPPRLGRNGGHSVRRVAGEVVELGDRGGDAGERRVRADVPHALAVHDHRAAITQ
jgi:hypothetical protein